MAFRERFNGILTTAKRRVNNGNNVSKQRKEDKDMMNVLIIFVTLVLIISGVMFYGKTKKSEPVQKVSHNSSTNLKPRHAQQERKRTAVSSKAKYIPFMYGDRVYGKLTMTPKEYGEYLLLSGKKV